MRCSFKYCRRRAELYIVVGGRMYPICRYHWSIIASRTGSLDEIVSVGRGGRVGGTVG